MPISSNFTCVNGYYSHCTCYSVSDVVVKRKSCFFLVSVKAGRVESYAMGLLSCNAALTWGSLCCPTDREGLSEAAHHLPEQEACSGSWWWQGGQGKAPPLPQKCGFGLQNPKRCKLNYAERHSSLYRLFLSSCKWCFSHDGLPSLQGSDDSAL